MRISNDHLSVDVALLGAELQSITTPDGGEWLWNGDAKWWTGRAPLLFPVVGKSPGNAVTIAGQRYPMQPHGFARRSTFELQHASAEKASLVLRPNATIRESFPFDFALEVTYTLDGAALRTLVEVVNHDSRDMPFGFGFHPAFAWPLPGAEGHKHIVRLTNGGEPGLARLNTEGLLLADRQKSPFTAGELVPDASQFEADAMLFPEGVGKGAWFGVEGGPSVDLAWTNLPDFAIWQKPGAPYLCLEPWHGTAARVGESDALETRPSTTILKPGQTATLELTITINPRG